MKLIDLSHLNWDENTTGTASTGGNYLKATYGNGLNKEYYKMSSYDAYLKQVVGYEAIFEVIVSRLCKKLGIPALKYKLVKGRVIVKDNEFITFVSVSKEFKTAKEKKITFEKFYIQNRQENEDPLTFARRCGFTCYIDNMFLLDFLICNRDRHGANIEVLKSDKIRLAPLFDNGISFTAPYGMNESAIKNFDISTDVVANNYLGSRSLEGNLNEISSPVLVNKLVPEDRRAIFYGLSECLPQIVKDKVWETIVRRYKHAKDKGFLIER